MDAPAAGTIEARPGTVESLLAGASLSDWFDPFLVPFGRETLACGGRVFVGRDDGQTSALLLVDPTDRIASIFARSSTAAGRLMGWAVGTATFAEVDLGGRQEPYRIHAVEITGEPAHRFQHRIRRLSRSELASAAAVLHEVHGGDHRRWALSLADERELCLAAELRGEVVGVAWLGIAGGRARLHTLAVRPGYRRLGIATDLIAARLWLAWSAGAGRAFSEIAEANLPSRAVAERCGLRPAGRLTLHLPSTTLPGGSPDG